MTDQGENRLKHRTLVGRLSGLLALWIVGTLYIDPASAQNASTSASTQQDTDLEEVVITGTLIHGEGPTGSELSTVTPVQIEASGATDTHEILATVPQLSNFMETQHPTVKGAESNVFNASIRNLLTLVLIDGHRVPASGTLTTQPDPDSIPSIALQRIEVVPDGASAIYGSDAVGGVVNFITRQNYDGVDAGIRYGTADDYHAWDASLLAGHTWSGGSALLAYEYSYNSSLNGLQRPDYVNTDLVPYGGLDSNSTSCAQPNIVIGGTNYAYPGLAPNTHNECQLGRVADLLWASERHSVFANVRQAVSDSVELWVEGNYSDHQSNGIVQPSAISVSIPNTNPYFVPVPGTAATAETVNFSAQNVLGTNYFNNQAHNTVAQITLGTDAKLSADWRLNAFINYGTTLSRADEPGFSLNSAALATAAAGTTTATALDPFGSGTSPAVSQAIGNWNYITSTTQRLAQGAATADGPIFSLPGGEAKLAVGGEAREEQFVADFVNGPAGSPPANSVSDSRTIASFYSEVLVPVVGTANAFPLVQALNLSVSGRYDHYNDFGSTTNPKLGVDWSLAQGLKLRGTWGTSFHAPQLSDLHAIDGKFVYIGTPVSQAIFGNDPQLPGGYNSDIVAGGNPKLLPEKAHTWSVGSDFAPSQIEGFKASITYYHVGETNLIQTPPVGPAIFSNGAYAPFIYRNATPAQIAAFSSGLPIVNLFPINPALSTTILDLRRQNLAAITTDGLDLSGQYEWQTSLGHLEISDVANYVSRYEEAPTPGAPPANQLLLAIPRWHSRTALTWSNGPLLGSVAVNYDGAYSNTISLPAGEDTFQLPAIITTDVFIRYTLGAKGVLTGTEFSFNVKNLFNETPPIGPAGPRTDVDVIGRLFWFGVRERF
jgi:iron complex outermembrane receptor protein